MIIGTSTEAFVKLVHAIIGILKMKFKLSAFAANLNLRGELIQVYRIRACRVRTREYDI
jgi:hypothetical protein